MKYGLGWLIGIPLPIIALWFIANQAPTPGSTSRDRRPTIGRSPPVSSIFTASGSGR